ncbi:hypothetical protein [Spiroplasma melliferum]|uniref:Uncharacterized protein n=2 Tax=Spiroplasma melliferum TaxID=2134 RepID=A0AAI9T5H6_SPIME|nr:hypothetical protein [Spiroplasma melliferum]KAI93180.1 hypothetical protein SPM_003655 [Spiroplasma melliferum KC3]QCO24015.1 hypothetical protein SRED_002495 [Spiroplasma melliferum]
MQNDMRAIYEEMCDTCKKTFKKIILAIRNDRTKDVNNLLLFVCEINPISTLKDDAGIMPIALINCKDNKYTFFWKTNFLDASGNPKVPVVNQTIQLSQETIDKIPTHHRSLPVNKPIERVPVVQQKENEVLESVHESTSKLEFDLPSKNEIEVNDESKDNNDTKEKPIDLPSELVATSPLIEDETIALTQKMEQNSMTSMRKVLHTINRKMQWKIWSLVVILVMSIVGFGIGGWQLYRYFSNTVHDESGGGGVSERTNITLLGGDLGKQVIEIEDANNWLDLYSALLTLEVGSKNEGKLEPQLLEAIKDPGTTLTFSSENFHEDKIAYAATIIINADKATNFYGITNIAIQAKSKRINIINLGTNLTDNSVDIKSDIPNDILEAVLANSAIQGKLSPNQLALLEAVNTDRNLILRINDTVNKTPGETSNIQLVILADKSSLYKGTTQFSLKVKWTV